MRSYWFEAHGHGLLGWRIFLAATIGPVFPPASYLAPKWKRDKWHRIACEGCPDCDAYYAQFADVSLEDANQKGAF